MLSVSLGHGFTQGDVPEQGTRMLVVTDNAKARGDALAQELGAEIRAKRGTWYPPYLTIDAAIDAAYAEPKGPVVVADPSDNAGGGAASDNTNIIRRLLERGLRGCGGRPALGPGRGASSVTRSASARPFRCASAARRRRPPARRSTPRRP